MKITYGQEMAQIDRETIDKTGMPGAVLMENAARAVARSFVNQVGREEVPEILVLAGSGNNGGDGFCAGRILAGWGFNVVIARIGNSPLKKDAAVFYRLALEYGVKIIEIKDESALPLLGQMLDRCGWIIDAVFGTGLTKKATGIASQVLSAASKSGKPCIAVDIPSGINSDNGEILSDVIPAVLTVTFGLPKWGHFLFPGAGYRGKLVVADIGFPKRLIENPDLPGSLVNAGFVEKFIVPRKIDAHKGSNGKLSVMGGSKSMLGAPVLTGRAALRSGTGYVRLIVPGEFESPVKILSPELVTEGYSLKIGNNNYIEVYSKIESALQDSQALALGPGIGTQSSTSEFIRYVLENADLPTVIDADGLNVLAGLGKIKRKSSVPWILTPHPREAARLLGEDTGYVIGKPLESLKKMVERYNAVVLLKGPHTLIMNTDGGINVNTTGNPGLAVMGSGDVLTGIIGSFLARGISPFEAASVGVFVHGLAGDLAALNKHRDGLLPQEIADFIPEAIKSIADKTIYEKNEKIELIK